MITLNLTTLAAGVLVASALLLLRHVVDKRLEAARLAKLGAKPREVPYKLPFGIDLVYETIIVILEPNIAEIHSTIIAMQTSISSGNTCLKRGAKHFKYIPGMVFLIARWPHRE